MRTLQVIDFINQHENWRELLADKPYCISIKDDGEFTILSYHQFESDFSNLIVQECRGLIIRNHFEMYIPVCVPFFKFFNYGEPHAAKIDWATSRVQSKEDGSLIKLWNDNTQWIVSTNNTILASKARVNDTELTFYHLFQRALDPIVKMSKDGVRWFDTLKKDHTYMFELCTPENRVVVPHTEPKLYHIGTRNNITLEEVNVDIGIPKPKEYRFDSIEACIETAKELPFSSEGYVVVDKNWNRVKIKSPKYVAAFNLKNNGVVTTERVINMLRTGESTEFLTYYPEFEGEVNSVRHRIDTLAGMLQGKCSELSRQHFETQKDFALAVKEEKFAPFYFEWRKTGTSATEWIDRKESWRLAGYIDSSFSAER